MASYRVSRQPGGLPWLGIVLLVGAALVPDIARADWRPYRFERWVTAKVTAYCPGACCCGKHADGRTSTGRNAALPGAAAAPDALPYGRLLYIEKAGYRLVDDTGGAMRRSWRRGVVHIDLRHTTHASARSWGVRWMKVAIYQPARRGQLQGRRRVAPAAPHISSVARRRREDRDARR